MWNSNNLLHLCRDLFQFPQQQHSGTKDFYQIRHEEALEQITYSSDLKTYIMGDATFFIKTGILYDTALFADMLTSHSCFVCAV